MKFFVAVALLAFAAVAFAAEEGAQTAPNALKLSEEQRTRVRGFASECIEKEGVTKEQVQELRNGNFANTDPKVRAFANCFLEKLGFLIDGVPQVDVINAKLGPLVGEAEVKAISEKCNGLKGADNGETAFKIYECYYTNHASWL